MAQQYVRLGDMLVALGLLTEEKLRQVLEEQPKTRKRIGQLLVDMGLLSEEKILQTLSQQFNLEILAPHDLEEIAPQIIKRVPEALARNQAVVPLAIEGQTLHVATADPLNVVALNDLHYATGLQIQFKLAPMQLIQQALDRCYAKAAEDQSLESLLQQNDRITIDTAAEPEESTVDLRELRQQVDLAPIVRLANRLLTQAIDDHASDIHIEPYEDRTLVRNRIDGVLFDVVQVPFQLHLPLVSRVKILANMDIAERRLPQDGSFRVKDGALEYDFRVSTLPTINGEKVVLRLLGRGGGTTHYNLESLGFEPQQLAVFEPIIRRPWGMVLMTGPTGSGKSTTLHTAITALRSSRTNIIAVEDPVEYHNPGIQQVQVRPTIGLDFAQALRSILRQDPDIIMVGEIRDLETAQMAVRAALTGHLLFSTLHTNDSVSTVMRLINIGIEPHLVSAALTLAAAQRLVRKICIRCREPYDPAPSERALFDFLPAPPKTLYQGKGCSACRNTGYSGRVAVYELFPITQRVRYMINEGAKLEELRGCAAEEGMEALRRSGLRKVAAGITTVEEIFATCVEEA